MRFWCFLLSEDDSGSNSARKRTSVEIASTGDVNMASGNDAAMLETRAIARHHSRTMSDDRVSGRETPAGSKETQYSRKAPRISGMEMHSKKRAEESHKQAGHITGKKRSEGADHAAESHHFEPLSAYDVPNGSHRDDGHHQLRLIQEGVTGRESSAGDESGVQTKSSEHIS